MRSSCCWFYTLRAPIPGCIPAMLPADRLHILHSCLFLVYLISPPPCLPPHPHTLCHLKHHPAITCHHLVPLPTCLLFPAPGVVTHTCCLHFVYYLPVFMPPHTTFSFSVHYTPDGCADMVLPHTPCLCSISLPVCYHACACYLTFLFVCVPLPAMPATQDQEDRGTGHSNALLICLSGRQAGEGGRRGAERRKKTRRHGQWSVPAHLSSHLGPLPAACRQDCCARLTLPAPRLCLTTPTHFSTHLDYT